MKSPQKSPSEERSSSISPEDIKSVRAYLQESFKIGVHKLPSNNEANNVKLCLLARTMLGGGDGAYEMKKYIDYKITNVAFSKANGNTNKNKPATEKGRLGKLLTTIFGPREEEESVEGNWQHVFHWLDTLNMEGSAATPVSLEKLRQELKVDLSKHQNKVRTKLKYLTTVKKRRKKGAA